MATLKIQPGLESEIRNILKSAIDHVDRYGYIEKLGKGVCQGWLLSYSRALQLEKKAFDYLMENGLVEPDRNGNDKKTPVFQIWKDANAARLRLEKNMNMTGFDYERSKVAPLDIDDGPDFTN